MQENIQKWDPSGSKSPFSQLKNQKNRGEATLANLKKLRKKYRGYEMKWWLNSNFQFVTFKLKLPKYS